MSIAKNEIPNESGIEADSNDSEPAEDYKNPEKLRRLYHDEGLSQQAIGERCGVTGQNIGYWMNKLGIEARKSNREKAGCFRERPDGYYEFIVTYSNGERESVLAHRAFALLDHSIEELEGMSVHHPFGGKQFNWSENNEVLTPAEHGQRHAEYRKHVENGDTPEII